MRAAVCACFCDGHVSLPMPGFLTMRKLGGPYWICGKKWKSVKVEADQKFADQLKRSTDESAQLRRSLLDLQNEIESLRAELAKLKGQDEQVVRDLADVQKRQKDMTQSVDERLRNFEPTRVTLDGREFMAEPSERRDYDAALAMFRKGEFAAVQIVFVDFLSRYANSGYRSFGLVLVGQCPVRHQGLQRSDGKFPQPGCWCTRPPACA